MDRRQFLILMAASACVPRKPEYVESADLPTLGGAPDTADGLTVAAFVDTVIPGRHRDPFDAPGGIDVGAPAKFFEDGSQVKAFVPLLTLVLDGFANDEKNAKFSALKPSQREEVLAIAMEKVPQIEFAVQLAKVSYYAAPETAAYLRYPGANAGYIDDPGFSFGKEMAKPLQLVVDHGGNFP